MNDVGARDRLISTWCAIVGLVVVGGVPLGICAIVYSNRANARGVPTKWQYIVGIIDIIGGFLQWVGYF